MSGDFCDPTPEEQIVVLIDTATLCKAEQLIESCEHCNREGAELWNCLSNLNKTLTAFQ